MIRELRKVDINKVSRNMVRYKYKDTLFYLCSILEK